MKTNHKTHGKTIFWIFAVALLLLVAILLPVGMTFAKYCKEVEFSLEWNFSPFQNEGGGSGSSDPANPDAPGIEEETPTTVYQVQPGDTLSSLAEKFHITVEALAEYNELDPTAALQPGTVLHIPTED